MAKLADLEVVITGETSDAETKIDRVNDKLDTNVIKQGLVGTAMMGLSKQGLDLFGGAIMSAVDFEAQVTDAYIALGGFEGGIDGLTATIMDLAEALPFSTGEVAGLIEQLGYLGVAAEDVEAVAFAVMALAMGIGEDLVPTAETLIGIMKSYGEPMSEIKTYAEQLFQVLNAGALGLGDIAGAWQYMGEVVQRAGLNFLDAAALITVLVDRTIPAERAGRALKAAFESLIEPSAALIEVLDKFGIKIRDDVTGNLLSARDIFFNIWKKWPELTKEGMNEILAAMDLGEFEGVIRQIFDAGIEVYDKFMQGVSESMSLWDAVKVKMGTAKSAWETFMETLGNAQILIGQQLLPAFRSVVVFLTGLVDMIKNVPAPILKMIGVVGLLATAFVGLAGAVGVILASGAFGVMATALGLLLNPITLIIAALAFFGARWLMAGDNMEKVKDIVARLADNFKVFRGLGLDPVQAGLRALGVVFPGLYGHVQTAISIWNGLKTAFSTTVGIIQTVASAVAGFVVDLLKMGAVRDILVGVAAGFATFKTLTGTLALAQGAFTTFVGVIGKVRNAVIAMNAAMMANPVIAIIAAVVALGVVIYLLYKRFEGVRKVVDAILKPFKKLGGLLKDLAKWVGGKLVDGWNKLMDVLEPVFDFIGKIAGIVGGKLMSGFRAIGSVLSSVIGWFGNLASIIGGALWSGLQKVGSFLGGVLASGFNIVSNAISTVIGWVGDLISWFTQLDAVEAIVSGISDVFNGLKNAFNSIMDLDLEGFFSGLGSSLKGMGEAILGTLLTIPDMLISAFQDIDWGGLGSGILNGITGALSSLAGLGSTIMGWIRSAASSIDWGELASNIGSFITSIPGKLGNLLEAVTTWIGDNIPSLSDWEELLGNVGSIVSGIGEKLGDLLTEVVTWITDNAPSLEDWKKLITNAASIAADVVGKLGDLVTEVITWITDNAPTLEDWKGLLGNLASIVSDVVGKLGDLLTEVQTWITDNAPSLDDWKGLLSFAGDITEDIVGALGDIANALGDWLEAGFTKLQEVWDARPTWLGGSGGDGGKSDMDAEDVFGINAKSLAETLDAKLKAAIDGMSGDSLSVAVSDWIGRGMEKSTQDLHQWLGGDFRQGLSDAITTHIDGMSGDSVAESMGQWFKRAGSKVESKFSESAMEIARGLDNAMKTAMTEGMSGGSLATSLQAWISKAAANLSAGDAASGVGMAIARSLDTAINQAITTGMSGASLAASLQAWIAKATASMNAGGAAAEVGLAIARSIDTATNTGLSALSGASLGAGISSWVGRSMTTVGTTLTTLGTSFGQLVNGAFVTGVGTLSGASLGAALSTWIGAAFTASMTSITTFVSDSIAVLGGWANGVTTNVTNTLNTFKTQISQGTSAGKQSFITFVGDVIGVMGGWATGIKTNVTNTMNTFKSTITNATNDAKRAFTTFGSEARSAVSTAMSNVTSSTRTGMNNVVSAIRSGMRDATSAIRNGAGDWAGIVRGFAGQMRDAGRTVGQAAGDGVAAGMRAALGAVRAAANEIISEVDRAMRAKARIASPSKMTTYFGEMIGEGLVVGMGHMVRDVNRASNALAVASLPNTQAAQLNTNTSAASRLARAGGGNVNNNVTIHNHYGDIRVDDLEELNQAVEFINDLPRETELIRL